MRVGRASSARACGPTPARSTRACATAPCRLAATTEKMVLLYFERQVAALCGQHCLNNLLQGAYFTEIDLAEIAQDLDRKEKALMLEAGVTPEARAFLSEPPETKKRPSVLMWSELTSATSEPSMMRIAFMSVTSQ